MNKLTIASILPLFIFACSSANSTVGTAPPTILVESGPPWENLTAEENSFFKDLACAEATEVFQEVAGWAVIDTQAVKEYPGRFIQLRQASSGMIAVVQFRSESGAKQLVEMFALVLPDNNLLKMLDFYSLRTFFNGETSPEVIFKAATGEYFCVFNQ